MARNGVRETIVNISSILGFRVKEPRNYEVTKAAVVHLTSVMAIGVAGRRS